ncbi:MAG TPA: 3-dehydroquinate synthase [Verrucomicrobiota bacterium]|nr:3-dehydroquinate synthase [Verrucomicrobiota bacterium]
MRTVPVSLGARSYTIHIGGGLLAKLGDHCRRLKLGERCVIITDANVGPKYADAAMRALKMAGFVPSVVTVPAGESAKSLKVLGECYDQLAMKRVERRSFVIALGGGCVGDLAGFVAASYLRGIAYVQVATTLLAQVDSSVGGKVGINLKSGKNLVGAFHQPRAVLCDLDTLTTLPDREFRAGLAEVVKYGIIKDAELFKRLERELDKVLQRDPITLSTVIARCCTLKAEIVAADEFETTGARAILNFGHTIGHGIEAISGYHEFIHGEAVSLGTVAAARLSARLLALSDEEATRIRDLLKRIGLPVSLKLSAKKRDALFDAMRLDKKVSAGEVKFVLTKLIGDAVAGQRVADSDIQATLNLLAA